jgi:hypothetical protein
MEGQMRGIYQIRERLIKLYKRNEKWINPAIRFIIGLMIFGSISTWGAPNKLSSVPIIILLSILTVVLPVSLVSFLAIIMLVMQLMVVSVEVAAIVGIALMCIQLFYIRVFPKESILLFLILLAYCLKVPYCAIFIGAIFFGFSSIVPVAIGTFLWYCIPIINTALLDGGTTVASVASADLLAIPTAFAEAYMTILTQLSDNQTWIMSIIIFAMVIAIVYIVTQLEVNYSAYLAIAVGSIVNIIGFILARFVANSSVGIISVIVFTLFSAIIAAIAQLFTRVLDYSSPERVQFEDEEFYYYVKVIPKVLVSKHKKH